MKRTLWYAAAVLLGCLLLFFSVSCSGDKEEKGSIEKMTEKAGKDAANKLKAPIDKAKAVKEQQEARDRDMVKKASDN